MNWKRVVSKRFFYWFTYWLTICPGLFMQAFSCIPSKQSKLVCETKCHVHSNCKQLPSFGVVSSCRAPQEPEFTSVTLKKMVHDAPVCECELQLWSCPYVKWFLGLTEGYLNVCTSVYDPTEPCYANSSLALERKSNLLSCHCALCGLMIESISSIAGRTD